MGGDGGVIASNRRYMRGAGTADHTADAKRSTSLSDEVNADRERCRQLMTTCALTGSSLDFQPTSSSSSKEEGVTAEGTIVACPHGRLYGREAAVEALLRRKQKGLEGAAAGEDEADWSQVRGLKDLHSVRFRVIAARKGKSGEEDHSTPQHFVPVCPITGVELNGAVAAFLIVRRTQKSKKKESVPDADTTQPNVLSERAIKEMGIESLQEEYGPFEERDMIRLAPTVVGGVFDTIKKDWTRRMEEERLAKKASKKGDKKRKKGQQQQLDATKKGGDDVTNNNNHGTKKSKLGSSSSSGSKNPLHQEKGRGGAAQAARNNVASAVASNSVLSSLFTSSKQSNISEKEKRDNLFAR